MLIKIQQSKKIKDLLILTPKIFYDFRGENMESFNENIYKKIFSNYNININFIIDSYSFTKKNVLRGFHGDKNTWKLIQCIHGNIYFVVIDLRPHSSTFNNHEIFNLNDKNRQQILIPSGCVNAHLCISDECIFNYKLSSNYVTQKKQLFIKWNSPIYNVYWPINNPILSERDAR